MWSYNGGPFESHVPVNYYQKQVEGPAPIDLPIAEGYESRMSGHPPPAPGPRSHHLVSLIWELSSHNGCAQFKPRLNIPVIPC